MLNEALRLRHEASSDFSGCYFHIISPDTDVIVLAVNFVQQIDEDVKVEFQLITSRGSRTISVKRAVNVLGKEHSRALLGAFIMTGCAHIGVFKGLTKSRCFNVFLEIESATYGTILDALSCLGTSISLSTFQIKALTRFVILLYSSKRKEDKANYSCVDDIRTLRWRFLVSSKLKLRVFLQQQGLSNTT